MSSHVVRAHGGAKDLIGPKGEMMGLDRIIQNTRVGRDGVHEMKHLSNILSNTTGIQGGSPVMEGVLTSTKQGLVDEYVPKLHKVHEKSKTQPKRMGQVPYAGPKY